MEEIKVCCYDHQHLNQNCYYQSQEVQEVQEQAAVTLDSGRDKHRLEKTRSRVLEGCLQEQGMLGASVTTPSNNRLLREFKDEGTYEGVCTQK